jgi:hypothetical protein
MLEFVMEHVNREGLIAKAVKAQRDKEGQRARAHQAVRDAQREADLAVARAMIQRQFAGKAAPFRPWMEALATEIVDWVQRARIDGEG